MIRDLALAMAVITFANLLPAFAPPTWSILVYFAVLYDIPPYLLIPAGVVSATTGRAILAGYMRHSTRWLPDKYVQNMVSAGRTFTKTRRRVYGLFVLFFVSPLSSAQLFAAAGMMHEVALRPLLGAFALGRLLTYSVYVSGATAFKATDIGDLFLAQLASPWGVVIQIAMVLAVVALGFVQWNHEPPPGGDPPQE